MENRHGGTMGLPAASFKKPYRILVFTCLIFIFSAFLPPHSFALDNLVRERSLSSYLSMPTGVAVDSGGGLYVSESGKNRLLVYTRDGVLLSELKGLDKPLGIAVDPGGRIYVCNSGRRNVEVYGIGLNLLYRLGRGNGEFELPVGVAVGSSGSVYVVDAKACAVKVYRPDGSFDFSFGGKGREDGRFNFPTSVSIDATTDDVIVSDLQVTLSGVQGARIQVFDRNGSFRRKFGTFGQGEGLLTRPVGTAVDAEGNVYVSDAFQHIVEVFDGSGVYLKTLYDVNRPMRTPLGVAVDRAAGKVYVASLNTSTVEVYGSGVAGGSGTLTFSGSGGGGACSMAMRSSRSEPSSTGYMLPLLAVFAFLSARRRNGKRARRGACGRTR